MDPLVAYQVTPVLLVPCTEARNCCELPEATDALLGETATVIGVPGLTVTMALDCAPLAALVAVTVTLVVVETAGAVYRPAPVIVPALADQETAVLLVPCTVALNGWLEPDNSDALVGLTATVIAELAVLIPPITICARGWRDDPAESITLSLRLLVPANLGVPLTTPVVGSRVNPLGSDPDATANR
jgi:hypothetical protein